ncbi:ABC transporter permease [Brevibacterium otitidis]|uniref:ABC transporter permease n=1 Tax=Brevibacterium otitidis TaxID=53364 RepID=A0ABV5X2G8_9MICO|nr:ABC transporter permease subunit [Brevibacterium otitidis]
MTSARTIPWGAVPFFAFVTVFLIIPVIANVWAALTPAGQLSTASLTQLAEPQYADAFLMTTNLSLVTALLGGILGLILAWALTVVTRPAWLARLVMSYAALASQSGGVPLAFAFIAALGSQGLVTVLVTDVFPGALDGFRLDSFWGVALVYLYFQAPLMTVLILPALGALTQQMSEAAKTMGASRLRYLTDIALPILAPSIVGALLLLFANSFSAYATAYALAGGGLNLVPIVIGFFLRGNVMLDESMAAALATGMMLVIIIAMGIRLLIERRSRRWQLPSNS